MKRPSLFTSLAYAPVGIAAILTVGCAEPTLKSYDEPAATGWTIEGMRPGSEAVNEPLLSGNDRYYTFHGNSQNTDTVENVYAPMFEHGWVAEPNFYVPEGPTFDSNGNIYFTPTNPVEKVSLVSVDTDGNRRWAVEGELAGQGGGPLILPHPEETNGERVYSGAYERIMAFSTDGTLIWDQPTGLVAPEEAGLFELHNWGLNIDTQNDAIIGVLGDGHVIAHDRVTGAPLITPYQLPGATPKISNQGLIGLLDLTQGLTQSTVENMLGHMVDFSGNFQATDIIEAVAGGGGVVANYFSIDPNTNLIWVASTAPDEADGNVDGFSELGGLFALQLTESNGEYTMTEHCHIFFQGGSSSTPAIKEDGSRVYIADDGTNVIAVDNNCQEVWRVDVEEKVLASIAVSPDNNELYAITATTVKQVLDLGDTGARGWDATMAMYEGLSTANLSTAGVSPNGVMVHIGGGRMVAGNMLPQKVGLALIDRETGVARYAAEGVEESIAALSTSKNGGVYLAHSPIRRIIQYITSGQLNKKAVGGIGYYKPIRKDKLVRDALCAAQDRADNLGENFATANALAIASDKNQILTLLNQADLAAGEALAEGDLSNVVATETQQAISSAIALLNGDDFEGVVAAISSGCASL